MHSSKGNVFVFLLLGIFAIFMIGGVYHLKQTLSSAPKNNVNNSSPKITEQAKPTVTPNKQIPPIKIGFEQYLNQDLKYGLSYPQTETLLSDSQCPLAPCFSTKNFTFKFETLGSWQLSQTDPKNSLLASDLYCSASGITGSIDCQDKKIYDYVNPLGTKGYKITQTKIVMGTGAGIPAGQYQDVVFVFPLPEIKKGPGVSDYAGILLTVDYPTPLNLSRLTEVAESFFTL